MLELENRRLQGLLQQLQNTSTTDVAVPDSARKRIKSEFGVKVANDFSESAVHASHSQQSEIFSPLATLTTMLLLFLALCLNLATSPVSLTLVRASPACVAPVVTLTPTLSLFDQWSSNRIPAVT